MSTVEGQTGALPAGGATSHAVDGGEPRSAEQTRGGEATVSMSADDVDLCLGRERGRLLLKAAQWEVAGATRVPSAPLLGLANVQEHGSASLRRVGLSRIRPPNRRAAEEGEHAVSS